jgi:hypothetical protein
MTLKAFTEPLGMKIENLAVGKTGKGMQFRVQALACFLGSSNLKVGL